MKKLIAILILLGVIYPGLANAEGRGNIWSSKAQRALEQLINAQGNISLQFRWGLADPNADRIYFWDDSAGANTFLAPGNSIAITGTTLDTIQDLRTTASPTFLAETLSQASLGTTSTDGIVLTNPTAAAADAQQISPRVRWTGQGQKTDAPAGSQTVDYIAELVPVQGAANPQARLDFNYQINGGGYQATPTMSLLNGKAGFGTAAPATGLHYSASSPIFRITDSGGPDDWNIRIGNIVGDDFSISQDAIVRFYIDPVGNIGLNNNTFGTTLAKGIAIGAGTDTTTNPADIVQVVVKDYAAGDARLYIASEAASSSRVVLGNGVRIGTNNGDGLVFDSLGTATKGIDLSGSGLSGSDNFLYMGTNDYWGANAVKMTANLTVGPNGNESIYATEILGTTTNFTIGTVNASYNVLIDTDGSREALLVGNKTKIGSLTSCTSNGTATITKTAHGLSLAAGDLVHITGATTAADKGFYRLVSSTANTFVVDRALAGSDADVALTVYKDVTGVFATDGTNGQRIMNYSHQNKPLQIGGDTLLATTGLTGEDVTLGGILNVDVSGSGLGFWVAPVTRPTAYTQTYATADKTHANFTSADLATTAATQTTPWGFATQAQADNIATQLNALRADVADSKQLLNSLIDDLQALGLLQ